MINNITIDNLVDNLELKSTNVLIGANGAGKTRLLKEYSVSELWYKNVLGGRP